MDELDWREPANDNSRKCLTCGETFLPNKHNQKYCGKECRESRRTDRKRDRRGEPRGGPERICENCGETFRRRADKHNAARFCSRKCGYTSLAVTRELIKKAKALTVKFSVIRCVCRICGCRFNSKSIVASYCSSECRHRAQWERRGVDASDKTCVWCSKTFVVTYGRAHAVYCSDECVRLAARKSPSARAAKAKRKAMARGSGDNDNVDPIEVFNRDGWRCQLCGVKTPKRLRGTYDPRAPELDHIMPISLGGAHTYANTQCSCRKCNGEKGAKFIGQMRLFG